MWLISFAYRAWFPPKNGSYGASEAVDCISLIEEHPAVFAATMKQDYDKFRAKKDYGFSDRADELLRIYSAIEVPDGTLNQKQREILD